FHVVDIKCRNAIAMLGRMVEQLQEGDAGHRTAPLQNKCCRRMHYQGYRASSVKFSQTINFSSRAPPSLDKFKHKGSQNQLHREIELRPGDDNRIGPGHETVMDHRVQIRKINASWPGETYDDHRFVGGRDPARSK